MKQLPTPLAVLILFAWGCVLAVGVGLYAVAAQPQRLVELAVQRLQLREQGILLSVGRLEPLFWPSPGLELGDLLMRMPDGGALYVRSLNLHLDWVRLLTGRLVPGSIELHQPSLRLRLPPTATPTPATVSTNPKASSATLPVLLPTLSPDLPPDAQLMAWCERVHALLGTLEPLDLGGLTLRLRQGQAQFFTADERKEGKEGADSSPSEALLTLVGVDGVLRLPGLLNGLLDLQAAEVRWLTPPLLLPSPFRLSSAHLLIEDVRPHAMETASGTRNYLTGNLEASALVPLPDIARELEWSLNLRLRQHPQRGHPPVLEGKMNLEGSLLIAGQAIPAHLSLPFVNEGLALRIREAHAVFEHDKASFNGRLTLPEGTAPLTLQGEVLVEHLSLSRWFGFARDLPTGLSHALNSLSGSLDVRLTPVALDVPRLSASIQGINFTGKGGVAKFAEPAIYLEATTSEADANRLFPELLGPALPAPNFPGPVLLASNPKEEHSVGFDIRLRAEQLRFWKWEAKQLTVGITPYGRGAQVAVRSPSVYGGSLQLSFGFEDKDVSIGLQLANIGLEQPVTRMAGYPALGGTISTKASFRSSAESLDAMLAGLKGQSQSDITNGFLSTAPGASGTRLPFSQLGLSFSGQGTPLAPGARLGTEQVYSGDWRVTLASPEVKGEATLKGPLRFSTANWLPEEARQLPVNAAFRAFKADVTGTANLTFHSRKNTLAVEQFSGTLLGGHASGSLKGSELAASARWEMQGQYTPLHLRAFLESHGFDLTRLPQDALKTLTLNAQSAWGQDQLRFGPFSGKLDETAFSGSIQKEGGAKAGHKAHWTANLQLDNLDLNRYLPKRSLVASPRPTVFPVELLNTFTLNGDLHVKSLTVAGVRHEHLRAPLRVNNGIASLEPIQATLAGGPVTASLTAETTSGGALMSARYDASKFNMLTVTRARKQESLIAGTAYVNLAAKGLVQTSADIPRAFNGQWKLAAENGYFVEAKKEQERDARRSFTNLFASGVLDAGVLRNDNLHVSGPVLNVRGQGNINLNTWTLDYRVNASLPGVPDIPVHFYGSLDNPESNVNALKAIGSALENLGRNAFDVIGDIITAPVKLFR